MFHNLRRSKGKYKGLMLISTSSLSCQLNILVKCVLPEKYGFVLRVICCLEIKSTSRAGS